MLKLNRTTEYGLIALSHIRCKQTGEVSSAREIADRFQLPFEILAKTLQKLKENKYISSTQGTKGGYILAKSLSEVNLAEFVSQMEGECNIVCCLDQDGPKDQCQYYGECSIKPAMITLNNKMHDFMRSITLDELTKANR